MGTVGYLLDTHTFLWAAYDEAKLTVTAREAIQGQKSNVFISAVSAFEVMNKHRLGKLPEYKYVVDNYFDILTEFGAIELPVSTRHAHYAGEFDWYHRDPFDRLLAAQAYIDNLTLITNDSDIKSLPWISVLW